MKIDLFKKKGTYKDKNGEDKSFTRFFVKCGDRLISIEPTYFSKKDDKGEVIPDKDFASRKFLLSAFSDELPEKDDTASN